MLKVIINSDEEAFEEDVNKFVSKCDKVTDIQYKVCQIDSRYISTLYAFITYEGKKVE